MDEKFKYREEQTIKFLQSLTYKEQLYLAFSGGKDSIVLYEVVKKSGINVISQHSNTTIDPPGTMGFIRRHYPDIEILRPVKSFYKLVEDKGLPTRRGRFCCQHIKERVGIGKLTLDGSRKDESGRRTHYTLEDCDTRKWMKGAKHIRPIVYWSNDDVWNYIRYHNLPYLKYYDPPYNFHRHGCIGCPLAGTKERIREYQLFPKYYEAIMNAIRAHRKVKPHTKLSQSFKDEYQTFHWWIGNYSVEHYLKIETTGLFDTDYKKLITKLIYGKTNTNGRTLRG